TDRKPDSPLLAVARGESAGVRDCLEEYGSLVWSLARRWLRQEADVEDAVQEIFIDLWKSADRFDPSKASGHGFVAMIARRRLIDRHRKMERRPQLMDLPDGGEPSTDEHLDTQSRIANQHVLNAVKGLRAEHRRFVELSFVAGLSHTEIADRTGTPLGTVKSAIRRSLLQLRKTLVAQGEGSLEGVR
ncbi:MAG: RNA polymerase sigma-70 factor (ECF subfamily), partial [Myxococcota bacterium]